SRKPTKNFISFFIQTEDGIRDLTVTGVQTCALPISLAETGEPHPAADRDPPLPGGPLRSRRAPALGPLRRRAAAGAPRQRHRSEIGRASCRGRRLRFVGTRLVQHISIPVLYCPTDMF